MSRLISFSGLLASLFLAVFAQAAQAAPAAQAKEMVSVDRAQLQMRAGAGTKHPVLWSFSKGYPLEVSSRSGNWLKVRDFENDTGWVYRPGVGKKPHVIVKASNVNLRSAPGASGPVVGQVDHGEVLRTLENKSQWVQVQRESGAKGWVARSLVWGW